METIAVYWEPVIRIYGFDIRNDISLLELDFPSTQAEYWGECVESLGKSKDGSEFIMAILQYIDTDSVRICMAVRQDCADRCRQMLEAYKQKGYNVAIRLRQPVDILFFHGPHFQDRFGIADAAFRALDYTRISLHTAGCTGTSVYMVVNSGEAELARQMLSESFIVPGHEKCDHTN